jgi:hypothetical protein
VELREAGSKVAVSTEPKCYIDTGICTVTFTEDKFREATLYIPVGLPTLLFSLGALYEVRAVRYFLVQPYILQLFM